MALMEIRSANSTVANMSVPVISMSRWHDSAVARLDRELETFDHDELDRPYRWNMLQAAELRSVTDDPFVVGTLSRFRKDVLPVLRSLPMQAIHNDANENNILVGPDGGIAG